MLFSLVTLLLLLPLFGKQVLLAHVLKRCAFLGRALSGLELLILAAQAVAATHLFHQRRELLGSHGCNLLNVALW